MILKENDKLLLMRNILFCLIQAFGEEIKIYSYFINQGRSPIYFTINEDDRFKDTKEIIIYESTAKILLLYIFELDYFNIDRSLAVLFVNKYIKHYSSEQIAKLLDVELYEYKRLEQGTSTFIDKFSYENLSEKLDFNIKEFFYNFKDEFTLIKGN